MDHDDYRAELSARGYAGDQRSYYVGMAGAVPGPTRKPKQHKMRWTKENYPHGPATVSNYKKQ